MFKRQGFASKVVRIEVMNNPRVKKNPEGEPQVNIGPSFLGHSFVPSSWNVQDIFLDI